MESAKSQLADKLKSASNILVTVSRDPSVDQLSALLGLTLLLTKQGKHAAAVYSGKTPSTIEFLKPEETIEKNTDSLQDFIIALDKSKADKLRYKVEDNVVRIFITPYKTSISEQDLEFSQGDFNVDVVVALGVKQQEDLDEAVTAHGRILHDATVASINISPDAGLGSINWHDPQASSLSELVTELAQAMDATLIDNQIATALLTGIVAETERFSNDKTSSQTMSASAALMAAGANQQLVATKLEEPEVEKSEKLGDDDKKSEDDSKDDDGTLEINHGDSDKDNEPELELPKPQIEEVGEAEQPASEAPPTSNLTPGPKLVTDPPTLGGTWTANSQQEGLDPVTDPLSMPNAEPDQLLNRPLGQTTPATDLSQPPAGSALRPADWTPPPPSSPPGEVHNPQDTTLTELEASVNSPHLNPAGLDTARDEVNRALIENPSDTQPPIQALNAQPAIENLHPTGDSAEPRPPMEPIQPIDNPTPPESSTTDPNAPPPVPPPIPFQFGGPGNPAA